MLELRKSPFKIDKIEDNPHSFALRPSEIRFCASKLFNNRNILISGPRGIGKTSLAKQLQLFYKGEQTLLNRVDIKTIFPEYLCSFYKCDEASTLTNLSLDLLSNLEQECLLAKRFSGTGTTKVKFELNLGVFKAAIEKDIITSSPSSIATQFVNGLREIYFASETIGLSGICLIIDEADMVEESINLANFLRLIHEYVNHFKFDGFIMILTGQLGTYSRLIKENPSVERMFYHLPISKLEFEESAYILDYASANANPSFVIEEDARDLILKIACGYPYIIHLLGDAAFSQMKIKDKMTQDDVLKGLRVLLQSDKQEKYLGYLKFLPSNDRIVIAKLSAYDSTELPVKIPFIWIMEELAPRVELKQINKSLCNLQNNGHLIIDKTNEECIFNDELFRIFLKLRTHELIDTGEGTGLTDDLYDRAELVPFDENQIEDVLSFMSAAESNRKWAVDEYAELFAGDDELIGPFFS